MLKKLLFLMIALALATASAASHRLTLFQPSVVNGTELKPGDYKLEVGGDKVVIKRGSQTVESPVRIENAGAKFSSTSVRYTNSGGKYHVQEIRLGGTSTKLIFAN